MGWRWGNPPPEQTHACEKITSRRTTRGGGKKQDRKSDLHQDHVSPEGVGECLKWLSHKKRPLEAVGGNGYRTNGDQAVYAWHYSGNNTLIRRDFDAYHSCFLMVKEKLMATYRSWVGLTHSCWQVAWGTKYCASMKSMRLLSSYDLFLQGRKDYSTKF